MSYRTPLIFALALAAAASNGCDKKKNPTNSGGGYDPVLPTSWAASVTNSFFTLVPGTTFQFRAQTSQGVETVTVEVQSDTHLVQGVAAAIVRDRVFLDGALIEDTIDWYGQDAAGNVWYLGEDSKQIENGVVVGTEGSWVWGVDGALPGIIMWADPLAHLNEEYRQEFYEGEAEDWGKVLAGGVSITVPFGTLTGCVQTEEWSGLETGPHELKFYAPGIGFALETHATSGERLELISITPP